LVFVESEGFGGVARLGNSVTTGKFEKDTF
jgi:hypothetical protein